MYLSISSSVNSTGFNLPVILLTLFLMSANVYGTVIKIPYGFGGYGAGGYISGIMLLLLKVESSNPGPKSPTGMT